MNATWTGKRRVKANQQPADGFVHENRNESSQAARSGSASKLEDRQVLAAFDVADTESQLTATDATPADRSAPSVIEKRTGIHVFASEFGARGPSYKIHHYVLGAAGLETVENAFPVRSTVTSLQAVAQGGCIYLAWIENEYWDPEWHAPVLRLAVSGDGGWGDVETVSDEEARVGAADRIELAVGRRGGLRVYWIDYRTVPAMARLEEGSGRANVYLRSRSSDGWGPIAELPRKGRRETREIAIESGRDGPQRVFWLETDGRRDRFHTAPLVEGATAPRSELLFEVKDSRPAWKLTLIAGNNGPMLVWGKGDLLMASRGSVSGWSAPTTVREDIRDFSSVSACVVVQNRRGARVGSRGERVYDLHLVNPQGSEASDLGIAALSEMFALVPNGGGKARVVALTRGPEGVLLRHKEIACADLFQ